MHSPTAGPAVSRALRTRRRALGLTLRELAAASGLSVAFLSQAERAQTVPSDVSLAALAAAMTVDVDFFFRPIDPGPVIRHTPPSGPDETPVPVRLTNDLPDRRLDATLVTLLPGQALPTAPAAGELFCHLLGGHVHLVVGDSGHDLAPGDSAHFDGSLSHGVRATGAFPARILWIRTPPSAA